jgi:FixJ family two-component response regulator
MIAARKLSRRPFGFPKLPCVVEEKGNKEVAGALGTSVRTVEIHRAGILRKLNLDSTAALVRYAIRSKMIEP